VTLEKEDQKITWMKYKSTGEGGLSVKDVLEK